MKFMMMVKADKDYEAGIPPSPALSKADAIALGARLLKVHEEALGPSYVGEIEIRQMAEW